MASIASRTCGCRESAGGGTGGLAKGVRRQAGGVQTQASTVPARCRGHGMHACPVTARHAQPHPTPPTHARAQPPPTRLACEASPWKSSSACSAATALWMLSSLRAAASWPMRALASAAAGRRGRGQGCRAAGAWAWTVGVGRGAGRRGRGQLERAWVQGKRCSAHANESFRDSSDTCLHILWLYTYKGAQGLRRGCSHEA